MPGLKYAVIGSGSSSNAYIFEYNNFSVVVDNGFSCRKFIIRAEELGFDVNKVKYLFLTHAHQDHFKGVEVLSKKLKIPVVIHEKLNINKKLKSHLYKRHNIRPGQIYSDGSITYKAFYTSHDADYSISYHFMLGGTSFIIITDTGEITEEMKALSSASNVIFLEANYNENMLKNGPYPFLLKERITSPYGHLSNRKAISFLNEVTSNNESEIKKVYFCHLSSTNNKVEVLKDDIEKYLTWKGDWAICPKDEPVACN